jgi:hypothetical protein
MATRCIFFSVVLAACAIAPAQAQLITGGESLIEKYNPFRHLDPGEPVSVIDLSNRLDCISEKLRNDGLVVIKQPDVFSQARMTHFRTDFENQMRNDLSMFHLVLAARINRLDSATTTQSTNLSASLSAPGTTHATGSATSTSSAATAVPVPAAPSIPSNGSIAPGTSATLDPNKNAFAGLGLDASNPAAALAATNAAAALSLGVEPTVYLDEKKRFLEYLAQIRRINHGPDQNDSSGYGLYLVRLPVSITPGECTYQGYGAELAVTVEHEFPKDFVRSSFQNFVINDLVDQLGPVVYEVIRSGLFTKLKDYHDLQVRYNLIGDTLEAQIKLEIETVLPKVRDRAASDQKKVQSRAPGTQMSSADYDFTDFGVPPLVNFLLRDLSTYPPDTAPDRRQEIVEKRFSALKALLGKLVHPLQQAPQAIVDDMSDHLDGIMNKLRTRQPIGDNGPERRELAAYVNSVLLAFARSTDPAKPEVAKEFKPEVIKALGSFYSELVDAAFPDDVAQIDIFLNKDVPVINPVETQLQLRETIQRLESQFHQVTLNLPSTRNPKQQYPIAPQEVGDFFLWNNIYVIADGAIKAAITKNPHLTDVRNFLRHSLYDAYAIMAKAVPGSGALAPLDDTELMDKIHQAVKARDFGRGSKLSGAFDALIEELQKGRGKETVYNQRQKSYRPLLALSWAIAVDAGLLDEYLHVWIPKVFKEHDNDFAIPDGLHFYVQDEASLAVTGPIFNDFVKYRWPIITFAIDPVTDQQNVADSYTLQRDLQLALSFAFATGQISFSQMNTFRRQLQQSSDTIALNRTVTGFIHGNDNFGFRFTPRFQNPPQQRTNIGVIASQLIGGGPGPDYQTKKSKLESGMREITAILLVPQFLPTMRLESTTNWFKLVDPEHLIFHTKSMLQRGREVQELRQAVVDACSAEKYRPADLNVLRAKLAQLEAMLPSQSTVIQLPFENTACGFDIFTEGARALVPEISGYEGVDIITKPSGTPAPTFLADIFIYGKYVDLLDTKVIVGGSYLPPSPAGPPATGGFEILSREVVHAQIPLTAQPTVTIDNKTYLEVYLATPSGISNRLLVPYQATVTPNLVAYDLDTDSQELDVYYQWWPDTSPTATLVATNDPGTAGLKIKWDNTTGLAPKTLQATFSTTINGQSLQFSMQANSGVQDQYVLDKQLMTVILLKRLHGIYAPPAALPTQLSLSVSVQPYIPQNSMGYRVLSAVKTLPTPLTVKLFYNATADPKLKDILEPPPLPPAPAPKKTSAAAPGAQLDEPVRTASFRDQDLSQQSQLPNQLQLNDLITPPAPPSAAELAGRLSQAATSTISSAPTASQIALTQASNAIPTAAQLQAQLPQLPQSIVVHSSPVTVVAPSTVLPPKSRSLLSRLLHRNSGNQATPPGSSR